MAANLSQLNFSMLSSSSDEHLTIKKKCTGELQNPWKFKENPLLDIIGWIKEETTQAQKRKTTTLIVN